MASLSAFAQAGGYTLFVGVEERELAKLTPLQRMERAPVIARNQDTLKAIAEKYDLAYETLVTVLHHEYTDTLNDWMGIKDAIQNDCASQGTLKYTGQNVLTKASYVFQLENNLTGCNQGTVDTNRWVEEKTARQDLEKFFQYRQADQEDECANKKHPVRNGNTYWFFNSIGIAQMQIYVALGLAIDQFIQNPWIVRSFKDDQWQWHLSRVAKVLADDEAASIEILAAELSQARKIWDDELKLDLNDGLPLSKFKNSKGLVSLSAVDWLLSAHQSAALKKAAKRQNTPDWVCLESLTKEEKKDLFDDLTVPAPDVYLQLHLRGNFKAYAKICLGV